VHLYKLEIYSTASKEKIEAEKLAAEAARH
jgi:hypothetical protein